MTLDLSEYILRLEAENQRLQNLVEKYLSEILTKSFNDTDKVFNDGYEVGFMDGCKKILDK